MLLSGLLQGLCTCDSSVWNGLLHPNLLLVNSILSGRIHRTGQAPITCSASSLAFFLALSSGYTQSLSVMSSSLQHYGLQSSRLLCPWDSPGKNTRLGCPALLPGDLPDAGIELVSLMSPALAGVFFFTNSTK